MSEDPFTLAYNKLWEYVDKSDTLTTYVRKGNRIKFVKDTKDFDPRKSTMTAGATPELMLIPDTFVSDVISTNNSSTITKTYSWVIRTSTRLINIDLLPVEWELYKVMYKASRAILGDLVFNNENIIKKLSIAHGAHVIPEVGQERQNPYLIGWRTTWDIQLEFEFSKATCLA